MARGLENLRKQQPRQIRDRYGNIRYTGEYENKPRPYTRPGSWNTVTSIGRLPAVSGGERGVLAQVGRGRPGGLIRMLMTRR